VTVVLCASIGALIFMMGLRAIEKNTDILRWECTAD